MKHGLQLSLSVSSAAVIALGVAIAGGSHSMPGRAAVTPCIDGANMLSGLPVAFIPNLGQWEHKARYLARIGALNVFLENRGWTFTIVERPMTQHAENMTRQPPKMQDTSLPSVAVRMTFASASEPVLAPEDLLPGRHNYFLSNESSRWRSEVPIYRSVRYREMYPGIDVRVRGQGGHFEYDLIAQPGADPSSVEVDVEGIDGMRLDDETLVFATSVGSVRMPPPLSWEEGPHGERRLVSCRYLLRSERRFGFVASGRRGDGVLTVDPGLEWSTFLGGSSSDIARAIAVDSHGASTVIGYTSSANFPTTPGAFRTTSGGYGEVFVTQIAPTGAKLVYSTFLGTTAVGWGVAVDGQGGATIVGSAGPTFPTTPGAFDTTFNGGGIDAFITRLSPTGSSLVYSTFLGGSGDEEAYAVAVDAQGTCTVAGWTASANFPTTLGSYDPQFNGGVHDAYVTRLSPTGSSLVFSTYLGGTKAETPQALALDTYGATTVTGDTNSPDFPTTLGAFDTSFDGMQDIFVTRLSPTGTNLMFSTFLGGATGGDYATSLGLDGHGRVTVAGYTTSTDFPVTPGAFDTTSIGTVDGFITRLTANGTALVYSTFLGGDAYDVANSLAVDSEGAVTIVGQTTSADFPTTVGAYDTTFNGGTYEAFITRLSPTGSSLVYSTFLGGANGGDFGLGIALDQQGRATVIGATGSSDFPTTPGAYDTIYNGGTYDTFVTRLEMLPRGVAAFGRSSPGCTGTLPMSVNTMPRVGSAQFGVTCGNARPATLGVCAFTANRLASPMSTLGVEVWIDPGGPYVQILVISNAIGASQALLGVPNNPALAGARLFAQFFWVDSTYPPPCPALGWSASNGLDITIQP